MLTMLKHQRVLSLETILAHEYIIRIVCYFSFNLCATLNEESLMFWLPLQYHIIISLVAWLGICKIAFWMEYNMGYTFEDIYFILIIVYTISIQHTSIPMWPFLRRGSFVYREMPPIRINETVYLNRIVN